MGGELKAPVAKLLGWNAALVIASPANSLEAVLTNESDVLMAAQRGTLDGLAAFYDCYKEEAEQLSIIAFAVLAAFILAAVISRIGSVGAVLAGSLASVAIARAAAAIALEVLAAYFPRAAVASPSSKEECECGDKQKGICTLTDGQEIKVGQLAFRYDLVPPSVPHFPFAGSHVHLYSANQNPKNCQCFWKEKTIVAPPPPAEAIPIQPFRE